MTIAHRNPKDIIAFTCESTSVAEGAVVVIGAADNNCMLPGAADTTTPALGLAWKAGSSTANRPLDVVTNGIYPGVAAASITKGDILVVANTSGGVKPIGGSPTASQSIIGEALEAASSGERVAIRLNLRQYQK